MPVGRGGERRAIGLGNPGLPGDPYATPTLSAALRYLAPRENAPEARHTQSAFRFVLEGEGVWTVVDGDPVAMRRGDLLLTPGWHFHGHQNVSDAPMAWLDGLDIPLVATTDRLFEFGPDKLSDPSRPDRSRGERLWACPGLIPVSARRVAPGLRLMAYRWAPRTRRCAPNSGWSPRVTPACWSPVTPRSGSPTPRPEVTRSPRCGRRCTGCAPGPARPAPAPRRPRSGRLFDGRGTVTLDGEVHQLAHGDVFAVPSWCELSLHADTELDLFTFSDAPVFEKLSLLRTEVTG